MKKILISIFVAMILCSAWGCNLNLEKSSKNLCTYTAELSYDDTTHTLSGQMEVNYVNKSNQTLGEIKFNLFANAFREDSQQSVISLAKAEECYYNGKSYGGIQILNTKYDSNYVVAGQDQNVLTITLPSPLQIGNSAKVEIEFEITLPNISHRFGYGENTINFGNFLPTLCVFENGQWQELTYHSNGDPFYSETANYFVSVTYPEDMILITSGTTKSTEIKEGKATKQIYAPAVRDFAMVLSNNLSVVSSEVDGICINYYYHADQNFTTSLSTATKAVKTYNGLFGKYPYSELNVVEADFCIGGMEFPNLVLIGNSIADYDSYQMVIVHEIAHQWWYGVVGNNQTAHAWLDEGLAEFSTALFYEKNKGYKYSYENLIDNANLSMQVFSKVNTDVLGKVNLSMNRTLDQFANENEYIHTAYVEGLLLFDGLKNLLSEKVVVKCLKNYFVAYAFQVAKPEHLIASFEKTTSCNLEPFFNTWIEGKVVFSTT